VAIGGVGVLLGVALGGSGVLVGSGVAVGGTGVLVGGRGVLVGVLVGVSVGGTDVAVCVGVLVEVGVKVGGGVTPSQIVTTNPLAVAESTETVTSLARSLKLSPTVHMVPASPVLPFPSASTT
jgi:hypothetical protein